MISSLFGVRRALLAAVALLLLAVALWAVDAAADPTEPLTSVLGALSGACTGAAVALMVVALVARTMVRRRADALQLDRLDPMHDDGRR